MRQRQRGPQAGTVCYRYTAFLGQHTIFAPAGGVLFESFRSSRDCCCGDIVNSHYTSHTTRRCACPRRSALVSVGGDPHKTGDRKMCHPTTHKERSSRLTTKAVSRRTTGAASTKASLQVCLIISVCHCLPHFTSGLIDGIHHQPRTPHHTGRLTTHH